MYLNHPLSLSFIGMGNRWGLVRCAQALGFIRVAAIDQFVNPASKGALYNLGCYPMSRWFIRCAAAIWRVCSMICKSPQQSADEAKMAISVEFIWKMMRFNERFTAQLIPWRPRLKAWFYDSSSARLGNTLDTNPWLPTEENTSHRDLWDVDTWSESRSARRWLPLSSACPPSSWARWHTTCCANGNSSRLSGNQLSEAYDGLGNKRLAKICKFYIRLSCLIASSVIKHETFPNLLANYLPHKYFAFETATVSNVG